jgi:hypothetical protein
MGAISDFVSNTVSSVASVAPNPIQTIGIPTMPFFRFPQPPAIPGLPALPPGLPVPPLAQTLLKSPIINPIGIASPVTQLIRAAVTGASVSVPAQAPAPVPMLTPVPAQAVYTYTAAPVHPAQPWVSTPPTPLVDQQPLVFPTDAGVSPVTALVTGAATTTPAPAEKAPATPGSIFSNPLALLAVASALIK